METFWMCKDCNHRYFHKEWTIQEDQVYLSYAKMFWVQISRDKNKPMIVSALSDILMKLDFFNL